MIDRSEGAFYQADDVKWTSRIIGGLTVLNAIGLMVENKSELWIVVSSSMLCIFGSWIHFWVSRTGVWVNHDTVRIVNPFRVIKVSW